VADAFRAGQEALKFSQGPSEFASKMASDEQTRRAQNVAAYVQGEQPKQVATARPLEAAGKAGDWANTFRGQVLNETGANERAGLSSQTSIITAMLNNAAQMYGADVRAAGGGGGAGGGKVDPNAYQSSLRLAVKGMGPLSTNDADPTTFYGVNETLRAALGPQAGRGDLYTPLFNSTEQVARELLPGATEGQIFQQTIKLLIQQINALSGAPAGIGAGM
jgi:hypothetical protein